MSSTLNSASQRPASASLTPTPPFKKEGLLPRTHLDVGLNYRTQIRPEILAGYAAEKAAKAAGRTYPGPPCMKALNISLCFDGTNNHEPLDKLAQPPTTTNVARLYHASLGDSANGAESRANRLGFYRYYMQGVGTEFKEIGEFTPDDNGLMMAAGGENRINWGITRLLDAVGRACGDERLQSPDAYALVKKMGTSVTEDMLGASLLKDGFARRQQALQAPLLALQKKVDYVHARKTVPRIIGMRLWIYGFSRGAAEARAFANWLEALTKVEVEGETCYLFAGIPISIGFMGLFDTVAAVGVAYVAPFAAGHMGWADDSMRLPDSEKFLERCVHLVAAHEQRGCFPLDSIRRKDNPDDPNGGSTYRNGTFEYLYPGVHSDVGGGYAPGEQGKAVAGGKDVLSQIPLHHMYAEAYALGAPLQAPPFVLSPEQKEDWPWLEMSEKAFRTFDVSETLTHRFNTWLSFHKTGPLKEAMESELEMLTAWRINRYASYRFKHTAAYQHFQGKDMTPPERGAFKALHQRQFAEEKAIHEGRPLRELSGTTLATHEEHLAIKLAYEQRIGAEKPTTFNMRKAFEPSLDQAQMDNAMDEFRRDYVPSFWGLSWDADTLSLATLAHVTLGGWVYLTNEEDEAEEYIRMRRKANIVFNKLYAPRSFEILSDRAQTLTDFFDEQVHDSRAWFMNAALGERELFTDYFRYRCIFFDNESSKALSALVSTEQVIGVAVAVASIGLSIKRHDPRYLVGLLAPSFGIPVFRGKVGLPGISAFDTLTGMALPMLSNLDNLRAFGKDTGDVLKLVNALPIPPTLSEETATTPELKALLNAHKTAKVAKMAKDLFDSLPAEEKTSWLDQIKGVAAE
ncbi:DUF2235 domain-containing protein [Pseudomonas sp. 10B1]|uniref:T6SS phospholipase effector Tle1-like catalytic domain-containing protein n=3 Tax=unclassified Pseudomonas TaxID=196821 RepID=UPI002B225715|nr:MULTISPECIES: DUF2235 domain-containing protein [unclassified Pseudomonas]MEB0086338.1 DUF2235 domain-containing protein [Pseudomonas sp. RTI1]MEB0126463.1 DUF2235 domain-containing protein [Pseudomonas sp. CCC1.2]MEB0154775.1 DUF2235 domain-containing protein [Pseudomonas sp. CCC4.3]MEB0309677.1 DUF2235 domain-containing protein [Pseudomonas sp. 10B1]